MTADLKPFEALKGCRVHLGVCGSIAAYKAVELMRMLQRLGAHCSVTLTESAARFIAPLTFSSLDAEPVYTAMFGQDDGPSFAHLQPGRSAHAMLVAPATATTIARLAAGLADEILSAQALAFTGPLLVAPAMNPHMLAHPATQANLETLARRGCRIIQPASGVVACGDEGAGKLAPLPEIVFATAQALLPQDMSGKTVLVTLGPTQEGWDGVRVWTNRSTGKMGSALVHAAALRGASVHAVAGPGVPGLPDCVNRVNVSSARDMYDACLDLWPGCEYGIFTAAVADFSPVPFGSGKFKKASSPDGFSLGFQPNPDILAALSAAKAPHQRLLGFAAESEHIEQAARDKLRRKKTHLLAANDISRADSGFGTPTNAMFVVDHNGREEAWPTLDKAEAAWRLLSWLLTL